MVKRYANMAILYSIIALVSGVFYREFTKFSGFKGRTNLSLIHTHYFILGMVIFLILMLLEKNFAFSSQRHTRVILVLYNAGLNITGIGFFIRGLTQVWGTLLSRGLDAAISGIAGIGHILLGISILLLLFRIKKQAV